MMITGKYKHYKGKYYNAIGTAIHSNNKKLYVIYMPLYGNKQSRQRIFLRTFQEFHGFVTVRGNTVNRFSKEPLFIERFFNKIDKVLKILFKTI